MQNQLQYPSSFSTQSNNNGTQLPKAALPAYLKTQDRTLPTPSLKHYGSNPNLSLEINAMKASQTTLDSQQQPVGQLKKNLEYRAPQGHNLYQYQQQTNPRPIRSQMTQSLFLNEQNNAEVPQEGQNSKKQILKNIPKRQYRMSETMETIADGLFSPRKEEVGKLLRKESMFTKKESFQQKSESRQAPSFLNREKALQMKRSQVVEPSGKLMGSFDFSRSSRPKQRKITVDDFTRIKQLGNGKYGRVYLVREKSSNFICALKVIQKKLLHEEEITEQFIREVKIQMFLNHPNIIKMYGCFDDTTNIYIILEVGTGGQLYHQLKKSQPLSQARIAFIMKQVCESVNEIHSLRIIHRDIKPENIVLHDNIIKLCDFGWSVHQDNKLRTTFCGTPLYVCPEILKGRQYDEKIDIWSIGIMMYEMVVGENPFKITKQEELIKIVKDEIKIPSYLFVSAEVRDFLDRCLQKNPGERGTIKELMHHPFFKKHQEKEKKQISL